MHMSVVRIREMRMAVLHRLVLVRMDMARPGRHRRHMNVAREIALQ